MGTSQETASPALRHALVYLLAEGENTKAGTDFRNALHGTCVKHFGWPEGQMDVRTALVEVDEGILLDIVEILCREGERERFVIGPTTEWDEAAIPDAEAQINDLFDRHRFSYRLQEGEIRKIGSPALDEAVVGPTLLAVGREGWEEVERSFKEAIQHQRGGPDENDDALTAANAALEAALKAAGFEGANLGPLAKDFKKSSVVPPELKGVPEALDVLVNRSMAIRSSHGDSHGKAPGSVEVPQELVDLAIHWAGAFIVYLSRAVP